MDHPELRKCHASASKRWGVAWTKAAAEMEKNYPICAYVGDKPTELAEERDLGGMEGKERKRRGLPVVNGEGAIITVLITIDHQLLAGALREGGDRRGEELWLEEEEQGLSQTCFGDNNEK